MEPSCSMRKGGRTDMTQPIVGFKDVENAPKNTMGPIIEHNTHTYHHPMALGLTTLAAAESLLMESTRLSRRPFPTDVIL